ncbi:MAG: DUF192 domain-containing protein [Actinomycetota bacterium]|nr:DUF192 domain-containing protein [Actinomycetota bacterium]
MPVVVVAALASLIAGCEEPVADTSGPSSTMETAATAVGGVSPTGFELVTVTIASAHEKPVELAMWLAGTPEQWGRGLTDVTDLGDGDGMLFAFDDPADYQFYMWQTPMPLEIVFFDASGAFLGQADMEPCLDGTAAQCPRYSPSAPYQSAIEVPEGTFDHITLTEATTIQFELPKPPTTSTTTTGTSSH